MSGQYWLTCWMVNSHTVAFGYFIEQRPVIRIDAHAIRVCHRTRPVGAKPSLDLFLCDLCIELRSILCLGLVLDLVGL